MATASKKRRSKKAARKADNRNPFAAGGDVIAIPQAPDPDPEPSETINVDADTGAVTIDHEDGSITVDPTGASLWQKPDDDDPSHKENLALKVNPIELGRISEDLLTAIAADKQDRSQWEQMRAKCIELLGLKLEDPKGDVSRSALGMSTSVVRDPTLLTAVNFFRANAYGELCPSSGPVKVVNFSDQEGETTDDLADALQSDLNFYLTTTASEYYPDMYFMLWWTGLASGTFKKVYNCPLRRRPVSEYVDGTKLIVPSNATDLKNAGRVTHEIEMRRATMRRMQILGVYRDIDLTDPLQPQQNAVDTKRANIEGKAPKPQRPEDQDYTVYECYCELDLAGFEHKEKGEASGLPLPYRVTIDETSREILEIRRNWDEDDEDSLAQIPFVLFPFSTGVSRIYGSGLGHEMGNLASALTALTRISIDNGMLANYPGMIKAKGSGRDIVNEIMIPPGGCVEIDTGGLPIQQFIMPLPYKDVSGPAMQLIEQLRGVAKQLAGTADLPVGEGRQDAPVGTTLALIEQSTKPMSATHKMLHAAQSEEFRQLIALFKDDPEALWRGNRRPALGKSKDERIAKFQAAIANCDIQPMADPNVPSEMHRKLLAMGLKQLTAGNPAYNQVEIDRYITHAVYKMPDADFNRFLAPPGPPAPPDPKLLTAQAALQNAQTNQTKVQLQAKTAQDQLHSKEQIEAAKLAGTHIAAMASGGPVQPEPPDPNQARALDLKAQQIQDKRHETMIDAHNAHLDRQSKETVKAMDIAARLATHPESQPVVNAELGGLSDFMSPATNGSPAPTMSLGGSVDEPAEDDAHLARQLHLALAISDALRERQQMSYTH